jgi:hypothetical protein
LAGTARSRGKRSAEDPDDEDNDLAGSGFPTQRAYQEWLDIAIRTDDLHDAAVDAIPEQYDGYYADRMTYYSNKMRFPAKHVALERGTF